MTNGEPKHDDPTPWYVPLLALILGFTGIAVLPLACGACGGLFERGYSLTAPEDHEERPQP